MRPLGRLRGALACAACALALVQVTPAPAADAPYVPTPTSVVEAMLDLARVGPGDFVIDLGSGDGRIVIAAAKRNGARGFGVDIDGALVSEAQRNARREGVADRVAFYERNVFITDIDAASVVTMYLFPQMIMRLRPRLLTELKPGARIVSHDFGMDQWTPDDKVTVPVPDKPYGEPKSDIYLWFVPANAAGKWRWRVGEGAAAREHEVALEQSFQMLRGQVAASGQPAQPGSGRMRGAAIEFTFNARVDGRDVRHDFSGQLEGDAISGVVTVHATPAQKLAWRATRLARGKIDAAAPASSPALKIFLAQE